MKIEAIVVFLLIAGGPILLNGNDEQQKNRAPQPAVSQSAITVESYLGKGFGRQIRQKFVIERIKNTVYPEQTSQRYVAFALDGKGQKNDHFVEIGYQVTPFGKALVKMLDERKSVQLVLIGYETLHAGGQPTGHVPDFDTLYSNSSPSWQCVPKFMIQGVGDEVLQEKLLAQTIVEFGEMNRGLEPAKKGILKKLLKRE